MEPKIQLRDSNCGGFVLDPGVWIGSEPVLTKGDDGLAAALAEVFSHRFHNGVKMKVSRGAVFAFDFNAWRDGNAHRAQSGDEIFSVIRNRIRLLNLFLTCFYTATIRVERINFAKRFLDWQTYMGLRRFGLDLYPAERSICSIHLETLDHAVALMDTALQRDQEEVPVIAELLLYAVHSEEIGLFEASLTAAWTIIERCLNALWESHPEHHGGRRNARAAEGPSDQKQKASTIADKLAESGVLPIDTHQLSVQVRQRRNKWLHRMSSLSSRDARPAILLANELLRLSGLLDCKVVVCCIAGLPQGIVEVPQSAART